MENGLTFEKVWAMFQETDRKFQEAREEACKDTCELKAALLETDRIVKSVSRQLGGIGNSNGAFAENYFYNSLNKTKMFGNEQFDYIDLNVKPLPINKLQDEYDIVLLNGKSVAIVEVKYRAKKEHIAQTINKAATFRYFFPAYTEFTIYLGLAGFSFEEEVEQDALNAGIAVLKHVGDSAVVYDKRLKKF